jgi:peptidoglycan/LPS O-acetylase OafA/YrhL
MPPTLLDATWCMVFFITGALLWVNRRRVRLSIPLLSLLLLACAIGRGHPWFQLAYFATLSYATVLVALVPRLPVIRHTDLSYGLYLYGWPAAQLVQMSWPGAPLHNMAYASLLALALAIASWFLVERPALSLKKSFAVHTPDASASAVEDTPGTHAAKAETP